MIRHRYYVGTVTKGLLDTCSRCESPPYNYDETCPECDDRARPVSDEQRTKLRETLCEVYGGYTVYAAVGAWRDGVVVKLEPSEVYEGLSPSRLVDPQALAQLLATIAEQSTVLWTEETVTGGFSA